MAAHLYFGDRIRRKNFLYISVPSGIIGWLSVAASHDASLVDHAL